MSSPNKPEVAPAANFIKNIVEADLAAGKHAQRHWAGRPGTAADHAAAPLDPAKLRTRFPPEPNGYLHFGHAKSILLNFGLAEQYGGRCHLRFDDTNPEKEEQEYVDAIVDAVKWLGCSWDKDGENNLYQASNYFDWMAQFAEYLISAGHAYVDSQSADEMRANRGTLTQPGKDSPFRSRSVAENMDLFKRMQAGEFADGTHILRARIDMAAPNINLRDPAIYRIRHATHHNTGDKWCVYPMYTFAHPIEDALENITHSICTLEFEDQRPFYDWLLAKIWPCFFHSQLEEIREKLSGICSRLHNPAEKALRDSLPECQPRIVEGGKVRTGLGSFNQEKTHFDFYPCTLPRRFADKGWDDLQTLANEASDDELYELYLEVSERLSKGQMGGLCDGDPIATFAELSPYRLPQQIEFSRLNLTYVVLSKRKLIQLVEEKHVDGWDDPRMPTLVGARRRGYSAEGFRLFAERIGVSKHDSLIDYVLFEDAMREVMNESDQRRIAVLDPVKLIIDNYPEGQVEECFAPNHPLHPELGQRTVPFSRELWIEGEDFMEVPSKGFRRLFPGNMARLRYGYVVECTGCDKDANGKVVAVHCNYLPDTKSGTPGADSVKVKGNLHWVSAAQSYAAEIRLFERLFSVAAPGARREGDAPEVERDFLDDLNPDSRQTITAQLEACLKDAKPEERFQFERHGYFVADRVDSQDGKPVFNRAVTLKDSWGKAG